MPTRNPEALDAPLLIERQESFRGGMDGYTRPALLGPEQTALAVNMILDARGELANRPGMRYLEVRVGPFLPPTGVVYFDTPTKEQLLVLSPGSVWTYEPAAGWAGTGAPMPGAALPAGWPGEGRITAAQGIDKLLVSDGEHALVLYDGTTWTAQGTNAGENGDPPQGATILHWHNGRMFASGLALATDTVYASDLLEFGTGRWNTINWSFRVGQGDGQPITALASLQSNWLAVLKAGSIYLVNTAATATGAADWTIEPLTLADGCVGPEAVCAVGNDVWYWGQDGVRSIGRMAGAAGQWEVTEPLSRPVQTYVDRVNAEHRGKIRGLLYKNLVLWAVPLDAATVPDTVLVYDLRARGWAVWTGWSIAGWARSRFADVPHLEVVRTASGIGRYMDDYDREDPDTFEDYEEAVTCRMRTRGLVFNEPEQEKDLLFAEVKLRNAQADVTVTVYVDERPVATRTLAVGYVPVTLGPELLLPFDLPGNAGMKTYRVPLSFLPHGQEFQLELTAADGNFQLKSLSVMALPGMLRCE